MGNQQAVFTDEQLEAYQDCTFFTRKDILRLYGRYRDLKPSRVPNDMRNGAAQDFRMPRLEIEHMPEFVENPFKRRIVESFSLDGQGNLVFGEFVDMFSVFSETAPRDIKAKYAFKIYDYDCDNFLGKGDLSRTLCALTQHHLSADEVAFVCDKILDEADLDQDGKLSFTEFEHVIERAPDFMSLFHIRI